MTSPACPSGNGEVRGPESAGGMGTPLPGSRPDRARANDAKATDELAPCVADQGGFGKEDMVTDPGYLGLHNLRPSEDDETSDSPAPNLAAMGDGGQTFGGM